MFESSAIVYAILGLVCFVAGQFYGAYKIKRQAGLMVKASAMAFESYQKAMKHVLTAKGVDYNAAEKEALAWTMEGALKSMQEALEKSIANRKNDEGSGG